MIVIFGENWYNTIMANNFFSKIRAFFCKKDKVNIKSKEQKTKGKKKKIPIILDVDTGIDDSVAIALALVDENLDIKLLTTCAGNTTIDNVTLNTLTMLQWFKRGDIPVCQGADKPLSRELILTDVHGGDTAMGTYPFPKTELIKSDLTAVDAIYQFAKKYKDVVLICTAPATNLALTLQKYPDIKDYIKQIVFQSGLLADPNYASFNVTVDPEAMQVVIDSGVELLVCPSDMGHITCLDDGEVEIVRNANKTGDMFATTFQSYRDRVCQNKVAMHDSCAVACVSRPDLFEIEPARCSIVNKRGGKKIFKLEINHPQSNCKCCTSIDIPEFKKYMLDNLKKCE